jgi:hypothetical protein
MSSENTNKPLAPVPSLVQTEPDYQSFLGAPPLIPSDDPAAYGRMLDAVTEAMESADVIGAILARDVTDLQWEIARLRQGRANFIKEQLKYESGDLAATITSNIAMIERIDRLIATYEARRNAALREAERHRVNLGNRVRRATEEIEDAEFSEIDKTDEHKTAA